MLQLLITWQRLMVQLGFQQKLLPDVYMKEVYGPASDYMAEVYGPAWCLLKLFLLTAWQRYMASLLHQLDGSFENPTTNVEADG